MLTCRHSQAIGAIVEIKLEKWTKVVLSFFLFVLSIHHRVRADERTFELAACTPQLSNDD